MEEVSSALADLLHLWPSIPSDATSEKSHYCWLVNTVISCFQILLKVSFYPFPKGNWWSQQMISFLGCGGFLAQCFVSGGKCGEALWSPSVLCPAPAMSQSLWPGVSLRSSLIQMLEKLMQNFNFFVKSAWWHHTLHGVRLILCLVCSYLDWRLMRKVEACEGLS